MLDERIDLWGQAARSKHPARMRGGLRRHIVTQTTLQDNDLYMQAYTDHRYGPHPVEPPAPDPEQDAQARKRAKLLAITTNESLDRIAIENDAYRETFQNYEALLKSRPNTTDQQQALRALIALRRMFVKREQINTQLGLRTFATDTYAELLIALVNEL